MHGWTEDTEEWEKEANKTKWGTKSHREDKIRKQWIGNGKKDEWMNGWTENTEEYEKE